MKTIESRIADLERSNRDLSIKLSSLMLNLSRLAIRQSDCHEDNADNIGKVESELASAKSDMLTNLSVSGVWDNDTTYSEDIYVMYDKELYKCLVPCHGVEPTDEVYWLKTNIANELNKLYESEE